LAEGKSVLAAMQNQMVQAQADGYCDYRRKCSHCGSRRGIKDWRARQMTTLFVVVLVETPRFNPCRFGVASRRIASPLIEIMPDRCTQEYERVLTKMGSLAAYGRAAALMAEFLPSGQNACDRNDAAANPSGGHEIGAAGPDGQAVVQPTIRSVDHNVARRGACDPHLSDAIVRGHVGLRQ